jgi:hypothetical protein
MPTDRNKAAAADATARTPSATPPTDDDLVRQLLEPDDEGQPDGDDAEAGRAPAPREAGESPDDNPDDTAGERQDAGADEGAGGQDAEGVEIDADALIEANPEIPVTVDGERKSVPLKEILSGYQRQADYTRGSQALAQDRQVIQSEAQRLLQQEAFLVQRLAPLVQQLTEDLGTAPSDQLIETDPEQYAREKARYDARKSRLDKALSTMDETLRQQRVLQQQRQDEWVQGERAKVRSMYPDTADPAKAQKLQSDLVNYLQAKGFNAKDIGELVDHRMFAVAMDALAGWRARKAIPEAKAKAKRLPIVRTSARPSAGEAAKARESGLMRLAKSGDTRVRNAALERLISGE